MRLSWPLIGRSEELRSVEAALMAPDVAGIVISGEPGVGKSRVAREALSWAQSQGWRTCSAVGTSAARSIPLGAFTAWAPPGVSEPIPLLHGVIESLTATSAGESVVVGVDDVHLLDDLSAFVIHQIVARHAAKVILTVRDGEPIPATVQEIWKDGAVDRLDLQPLPLDETTRLLSAALDGSVEPDAALRLWNLTRGNALYLRNIVEQEIADGRVARKDGHWCWGGDPIMPPGLVELIECRIGALSTLVEDVVDTVAVGEPIELRALHRIADADAVEQAEAHGLIRLQPTTTGIDVRLSHPIYGEVRRRRAPATKLRRLRGLIATELAASEDRDEIHVLVRRAAMRLDSDLAPDAELLTRAAHGAVSLADLRLADRLAAAASRYGGGPEPELVRSHALSWLGHGEQADAVLARIDPTGLTDGERARLAFLRASNMLWAIGDPARAKTLIDDASRNAPAAQRSYFDALLAVYWFAMDEPDAALTASKDLSCEQLPAVVGAELAWVLTTIDADAGRTDAAVSNAEAGHLAATRSLDTPHMRFNLADSHVTALLLAGRIGEATDVAMQVHKQAAVLPGAAQLLGPAIAGRAAMGAGDLRCACALLEQAVAGLRANHSLGWGFRYLVSQVAALGMRGACDEAADALAALEGAQRGFRSLDYEQSIARAWVAACRGVVSEAIAILLSAARTSAAAGRFAAEVLCLQTAAQFGDLTGACRLHELESLVEGPRVVLAARFAAALRDNAAAELALLSEEFERMGDRVAALDVAAHAALAYRRQDKRGSALGCATRAAALAEQCGARTPALLSALEPLPLTDREREIVTMIGQGMSSREIAHRLTLSVRTVESHVYRAMSKTGTTTRDELAALLPLRRTRPD